MHKLKQLIIHLRSSFWFLPTLMVTGAAGLAVGLVVADVFVGDVLSRWPRVFGTTPEGARQLLATIAGSMMGVMGVTFSMTLVALSLASSQYSSRILQTFMRSRVTQSTLGVFAGVFTYCLIVLLTVRSGLSDAVFVPRLALFFAFILALVGVAILIFFIHHIASSIQASSIVALVADDTMEVIDRLFPAEREARDAPAEDPLVDEEDEASWSTVPSRADGYIQDVSQGALEHLAREKQVVVRMARGTGAFIVRGAPLVYLRQDEPPDDATVAAVNAAFSIGGHRTVDQDPTFGFRQLVDVALKALSPGVNDTSTAVMCIDYLSAILARLADRELPAPRHYEDGELRVIRVEVTFGSLLRVAFDQIRRSAQGNVAVLLRLLSGLDAIAGQTERPARRAAVREQVQRIAELIDRSVESAHDRAELDARVRELLASLPAT